MTLFVPLKSGAQHPRRRKLHQIPLQATDVKTAPSDSEFTLLRILERRYSSRIWAVQELVRSRQAVIRIGDIEYHVTPQTTQDIARAPSNRKWDNTQAPWFQHASRQTLTVEDGHNLLDAVRLMSSCTSTDPRDQVFGTLDLNNIDNSNTAKLPTLSPIRGLSSAYLRIV
jgi:hypothetical protein